MKTIIAGSRNLCWSDFCQGMVALLTTFPYDIAEVVSGMARGPDTYGRAWALKRGLPCTQMPAKWKDLTCPEAEIRTNRMGEKYDYDANAGFRRNEEMAVYADVLIAFWDRKSIGTARMIEQMRNLNKPVYVVAYNPFGKFTIWEY